MSKQALIDEIKRVMEAHGNDVDLNYIDISAITDMKNLFGVDDRDTEEVEGYGLGAFEGDISKWDVSSVTSMGVMFSGATKFKQNLNEWGSRLHSIIKREWFRTTLMFRSSGLASNLPNWCENTKCRREQ